MLAIRSGILTTVDWDRWKAGAELSHLCHLPWCGNPTHFVFESGGDNKSRKKCVQALPNKASVVDVVCTHEPACHLRTRDELYSFDHLVQQIANLRRRTLSFGKAHQTRRYPLCGEESSMSGSEFVAHVVETHTDPVAEHMTVQSKLPVRIAKIHPISLL